MSDAPVRTQLRDDDGWLDFQDYFVRQRCAPCIHEIRYAGAAEAEPAPAVLEALADPALAAVIICPSNPMLSIEPMLAMPWFRRALEQVAAPVIAVSPIIGGSAVKGPTAKLMRELGSEVSAAAVAQRYCGLLDAFVVDHADATRMGTLTVPVIGAPILMHTLEDRDVLARVVLSAAREVRPHKK
jgi:LPPG:FO 2-phospho-L-lactate transferase